MIVLLNAQSILYEVLTATKLRLASTFEIPDTCIELSLDYGEGKVYPKVKLDASNAPKSARYWHESEQWRQEVVQASLRKAVRMYEERKDGARA